MKQAHQLMTVEAQADVASKTSRRPQITTIQPSPLLLVSLSNRLARAIAARDHVGAARTRGTLVRLSLQHTSRIGHAQRTYPRMMTVESDA